MFIALFDNTEYSSSNINTQAIGMHSSSELGHIDVRSRIEQWRHYSHIP
jgi:hypothetical protein